MDGRYGKRIAQPPQLIERIALPLSLLMINLVGYQQDFFFFVLLR